MHLRFLQRGRVGDGDRRLGHRLPVRHAGDRRGDPGLLGVEGVCLAA